MKYGYVSINTNSLFFKQVTITVKKRLEEIMLYNQLLYFMKTVECKSFTKAADELFISQSAISKSVKKLEEELQVTLIDRSHRKFSLTRQGEIVYDFAKEMFAYYEIKERELRNKLREEDTCVRFGLPPAAGSVFFSSSIFSFLDKNPSVDLKIYDGTSKFIVDKLLKGDLDIGIAISPFEDDRFYIREIYLSEAVLVVSKDHPLSKKEIVDFSELKDEKFVQVTEDYMYYQVFIDLCHKAGFHPNIIFKSNQWNLLLEIVGSNKGVSILPKPLIDKYSKDKISQVHLEEPNFPWILYIIYLKSKVLTQSMKQFINMCTEKPL